MAMQVVGRIQGLRRYPVKSMAGEDLNEVFISYAGLVGDRVYAFVDESNRSGFPWLTARQGREMLLLRPRFIQPPAPQAQHPSPASLRVEVETPAGRLDVASQDLKQYLKDRFGRPVTLQHSQRGMHDSRPVSLIGSPTIRTLGEEAGLKLDPRRFRANLYVEWEGGGPFFEDSLLDRQLQVGEKVTLLVVKKDPRCVIITLDPDTAEPAPAVLETVGRRHGGCAGVYAVVVREGVVRAGDPVCLL